MKVGVLGVGLMGRTHVRLLKGFGCEVIACDKDNGNLGKVKRLYNVRTFSDYDKMLDEEPDFVTIATPNNTHFRNAKKALSKNISVLVEKPLALNYDEARELYRVKGSNSLCVIHNYRFKPAIIRLKDFLNDGVLGKILLTNITVTQPAPVLNNKWQSIDRVSGGLFFEFIHPIDLLTMINGGARRIVMIKNHAYKSYSHPTSINIFIEFSNGSRGVYNHLSFSGGTQFTVDIFGSAVNYKANIWGDRYRLGEFNVAQELREVTKDALRLARIVLKKKLKDYQWIGHRELFKSFIKGLSNDEMPVSKEDALNSIKLAEVLRKAYNSEKNYLQVSV